MQDEHKIIGKIMAFYPVMDNLTAEEKRFFDEWISIEENRKLFDSVVEGDNRLSEFKLFVKGDISQEANREKYYAALTRLQKASRVIWWKKWPTYVAAASVIIALSLIGAHSWFGQKKKDSRKDLPGIAKVSDVKPGQFKAKLTLADGSEVILDSISNNRLVQQGGTTIYTRDGKLIYEPKDQSSNEVLYNTLTTAKAQTYSMVLPDGSKVWLNAQSQIRYPVNFNGDMREVYMTGEIYFEIKPTLLALANGTEKKLPFAVNAAGVRIEVLGTHFNVNAYKDEETIKTTLLEGKVKVIQGSSLALLKPGQQAVAYPDTKSIKVDSDADVDQAVAWKNGLFQFNHTDLRTVMRQIERWFDVEVVYSGAVPNDTYEGKIRMNSDLSQVLSTLEKTQTHFKIDGKKIIVTQ